MNKHCKGCKYNHNAGHAAGTGISKKFNNWCCAHGKAANSSIGWCKLNNRKELKEIEK